MLIAAAGAIGLHLATRAQRAAAASSSGGRCATGAGRGDSSTFAQETCDEANRIDASSGWAVYPRSLGCESASLALEAACAASATDGAGCCRTDDCRCHCLWQDFFCWCFRSGYPYTQLAAADT